MTLTLPHQPAEVLDGQTFGEWLASIPIWAWFLAVIVVIAVVVLSIALAVTKNGKNRQGPAVQQPQQHVQSTTVVTAPQNTRERIKCDYCSATYYTSEHTRCPYCDK